MPAATAIVSIDSFHTLSNLDAAKLDKMTTDVSQDQMQARIAAARREAEGLKERIKHKKDGLADTSRKLVC